MHMVGTTIRDLTQQTMGFRLRRSLKKSHTGITILIDQNNEYLMDYTNLL